jgi:hypothetical protein
LLIGAENPLPAGMDWIKIRKFSYLPGLYKKSGPAFPDFYVSNPPEKGVNYFLLLYIEQTPAEGHWKLIWQG